MFSRLVAPRRDFSTLSEKEILALAISAEEEDGRIYAAYADRLREDFPASAAIFEGMAEEEDTHRRRLIDRYSERFGPTIVPLRREHVRGFFTRKPVWLMAELDLDTVRGQAREMEQDAARFYAEAAKRTSDAETRKLLGDLERAERGHEHTAAALEDAHLGADARDAEKDAAHRRFLLTYVQPGLAGLMDGSISTLAPIFAAAFATGDTWSTFLVGLAASVGAGISMGMTEAASDDGRLTGRGSPLKRGLASGVMTTLGGLGHTLPYLIAHFWTATSIAMAIVVIELWVIAWIQKRFMDTPFWRAVTQVVLGGSLVFAAGILIGSA
ncbi:MAG TPA: ferritin family protein [Pelagibacterium sp.]|uniref:iron exporter MbfA n=1 Tax=Pelagibacterium sp. TaxID=1967288 RepID=UPI002C69EF9C|nr:ferritin family protein [Pelagibacterium sp.]HWJ88320.1 ferritin family protein [Pelagibacterium sp.]